MTILDRIKSLFGKGHIYTEFTCGDGTKGRSKAPFVGDPSTFNRSKYISRLKSEIRFLHGKEITDIKSIKLIHE